MSKRHKNRAERKRAAILAFQNPHAKAAAPVTGSQTLDGNSIPGKEPTSHVVSVSAPAFQATDRLSVREEMIRRRAYELYEKRGREDGHAEEDWLQAEAEIIGSVLRRARTG